MPSCLFATLFPDWRKARATAPEVVMVHLPTQTAFAIVYDPDQAMLGNLPAYGLAARIYKASDTTPERAEDLEAPGQDAIAAWLNHFTAGRCF